MAAMSEPLDLEEMQALSGMWVASLDLEEEEEERSLTCNLQVLTLEFGGHRTRLQTTEDTAAGYSNSAKGWEASTVRGLLPSEKLASSLVEGSKPRSSIKLKLIVGPWLLVGTGERVGLRCTRVRGRVLQGTDEEYVGNFALEQSLASVADAELPELEARWQRRLDARPAPPVRYARESFDGEWRLLVALDGSVPAVFTLQIGGGGSLMRGHFSSRVESDGAPQLAGSWGVYDAGVRSDSGRSSKRDTTPKLAGTHLWLRVERDKSTGTLEGIGGLPVRESFSMWGAPVLGSLEAQLRAATQSAGKSTADQVDGFIYFGAASDLEHTVGGRFSLSRTTPGQDEAR